MASENTGSKPLFREEVLTYGVLARTTVTALSLEAQKLGTTDQGHANQPQAEKPSIPLFIHSLVRVEIVMDVNRGGMSKRTWLGLEDQKRELQNPEGFFYWDSDFAGLPNTPEYQARFAARAARQLDMHETTVRGYRARGLSLVLQ